MDGMAAVRRIALAYNNVYVVEDGGERVLVDAGPDYRGAFEALQTALGGLAPGAVVATHGHLDHAGLGAAWQRAGVPVLLGAADAGLTTRPGDGSLELAWMRQFVEQCGAPDDVVAEVVAGLERRREWGRAAREGYPPAGRAPRWPTGLRYEPFAPDRLLTADSPVGAGLTGLLCPGHTPGNAVVVHEGEGWLFSGDQLLPGMTPTPAIQAAPGAGEGGEWRFRSLPLFAASLRRLKGRDFTRCYPGHGEPFDDVEGALQANLNAIEQRSGRVLAALREAGPCPVYVLAERLYRRAVVRRFWQIVPSVLGHLDLLEDEGRVRLEDGGYTAF